MNFLRENHNINSNFFVTKQSGTLQITRDWHELYTWREQDVLSDSSFTDFAQAHLAPVSVIRGAVTKLHAAIFPKQSKIEAIIIHFKTFDIN